MTALIILSSLILAALAILVIFTVLTYNRIIGLVMVNGAYQSEEYRQAVAVQKSRKPSLPPIKEKVRGRKIEKTDDLVDMADVNWEDGYKAIEEAANG